MWKSTGRFINRYIKTYSYELERNRFDSEYYREAVEDVFSREIDRIRKWINRPDSSLEN